jgi:hypothetical protein
MAEIYSMALRAVALERLEYEPDTGRLLWKQRANNNGAAAGSEAGNVNKILGYRFVGLCGKNLLAHRLIWLMVHGNAPPVVDHINRDKSDNRLANLRAADKRLNSFNAKLLVTNKSGYRGVSQCKATGLWTARINDGSSYRFLGNFPTPEAASDAYKAVALKVAGEFFAG